MNGSERQHVGNNKGQNLEQDCEAGNKVILLIPAKY